MEKLITALKEALENGLLIPLEAKDHRKPDSREAKFINEDQVRTTPEVGKLIHDSLLNEPYIAQYDEGWYSIGNAATQINMNVIAEWLLAQTLKSKDPKIPLDKLLSVIRRNVANAYFITVLDGIKIDKEYELNKKLSILPYEQIRV